MAADHRPFPDGRFYGRPAPERQCADPFVHAGRHGKPGGFGFNTSTLALGNMLGALVGGFLSGFIGIEGLFIISGCLLLLNMVWVRLKLYKKGNSPQFR